MRRKIAIVLWNGVVGGAEVHSVALSSRMRRDGIDASIVFIGEPSPLAQRLPALGVPYRSLGFRRGRAILRRPRRYADAISEIGPDGALLVTCGYMGAALRAGGYRGAMVAVEHGDIFEARRQPKLSEYGWLMSRRAGAWVNDVEIAVSDYVHEQMKQAPHAKTCQRIYNGIDLDSYPGAEGIPCAADSDVCTVAFAGRLIPGKGANYLVAAIGLVGPEHNVRLLVAGDGPERRRLEALAVSLGVEGKVEFVGLVHDMPGYWRDCDVAVVPSAEFIEACPMTPLEAMAAEKPVIATTNGGLPEIVVDGATGMLVAPSAVGALADAITFYVTRRALRKEQGILGRARVESHFNIAQSSRAYLDVFTSLWDAQADDSYEGR